MGAVVVLSGGLSHERDVSLRSGRRVSEALREQGKTVVERDVDASLVADLRADPPDCVVPMLHGETGEDGAIREVLELLSLPYVGAAPAACRIAFDKPVAKTLVARAGITDEELARGKGQLRGGLVLGLEDSASRMSRIGKAELVHDELLSIDEVMERIDAVTLDDVRSVAAEIFTRPEVLAVVGPS